MFNFRYIILGIALLIGLCSAFVSITGLSKLFAGAGVSVMVLMSALELGKLVTAVSVHRYWDKIDVLMRSYLIIATIILVGITSMGLYGFLSDSYTKAKTNMIYAATKVESLTTAKTNLSYKIERINQSILTKTDRLKSISDLRVRQEVRMDSLILNGRVSQSNKIRDDIRNSDIQISDLNTDIDSLNNEVYLLNDSIAKIDLSSAKANSDMESDNELGPIIYISKITGLEMDSVVNYLILIIVLVFDPLGIMLLILSNKVDFSDKTNRIEIDSDVIEEEADENKTEVEPEGEHKSPEVAVTNPPTVEDRKPIVPKGRIDSDDIALIRSKFNNRNRGFSVNVSKDGNNRDS